MGSSKRYWHVVLQHSAVKAMLLACISAGSLDILVKAPKPSTCTCRKGCHYILGSMWQEGVLCNRYVCAGTQLWVKLRGMCHWPVVMWSMELCMKKDVPQLLTSFKEGVPSTIEHTPNHHQLLSAAVHHPLSVTYS